MSLFVNRYCSVITLYYSVKFFKIDSEKPLKLSDQHFKYCVNIAIIVLKMHTSQRIIHVESIEFYVLQVQTSVDENSGIRTFNYHYCWWYRKQPLVFRQQKTKWFNSNSKNH